MRSGNNFTTLFFHSVGLGSSFHCVPFALCFGKILFLLAKESLILYFLSVTGHSKGRKTHVNANSRACVCFFRLIANITRDRREPLTRRRARDCARLRDTLKRSVMNNANTLFYSIASPCRPIDIRWKTEDT